jgi:hypothetical protein
MEKFGEFVVTSDWDRPFPPAPDVVHQFPPGETILGMVDFQGRLVVATNNNVYTLRNGALVPIPVEFTYDKSTDG